VQARVTGEEPTASHEPHGGPPFERRRAGAAIRERDAWIRRAPVVDQLAGVLGALDAAGAAAGVELDELSPEEAGVGADELDAAAPDAFELELPRLSVL
jgi:hypothetical protein